uniref:uroporphyrinogen-III synthase n=1 Tax=Thaumasiovibrio occultus TaxID=1891184 RepID=UPI000B3589D2|nr:uroporphyrinogen-III synthase [Thaumasiovibrio occultus]
MTLVIVRPAPDCHALAAQLQRVGISALAQPVQTFEMTTHAKTLPTTLQSLAENDLVIAVSPNAVQFAQQIMTQAKLHWPKLTYIGVGERTARELQQVSGQPTLFPQQADSDGVLALLRNNDIQRARVVIIRGEEGRDAIAQGLMQEGAQVTNANIYRATPLPLEGNTLYQQWQSRVTGLVVTSQSQLTQLWTLFTPKQQAWLCNLHLWVPSPRVKLHAQSLGFRTISCANSASNTALFATLSENCKTG